VNKSKKIAINYESVLNGEMLFEKSITAMMVVDRNRTIIKANVRFCELFGYAAHEIIGRETSVLTPTKEHFEEYKKYFEKTRSGSYESSELQYKRKDGSFFWVKLTGLPVITEIEKFVHWSFDDISAEVVAREEIKNRYRELEVIFDKVRAGLVYVVDGIIERANSSFINMVNDSKEKITGRKITIFVNCFDECKKTPGKKIVQFRNKDGETVLMEREIVRISSESYIIVFIDVTLHIKEKRVLKKISETDGLTGIYNRMAFVGFAQKMIVDTKYDAVSFVMLDIDYFKKVNDIYGHDIGDDVLLEICDIIGSNLRKKDIFGRLGGEEFGILFPVSQDEAVPVCQRILEAVRKKCFTKKNLHVTVSMGLVDNSFSNVFDSMYKEADRLLYTAKKSGRDRLEYSSPKAM